MINPSDYLQLGATAVVAIAAFWAIVQIFRIRKDNKNSDINGIMNELKLINENHLRSIEKSIRDGDDRIVEAINEGNQKIIELLGEIKGRLR